MSLRECISETIATLAFWLLVVASIIKAGLV